jgi:hypothetical protein
VPARLKRIIAVATEYGIAFSPPSSGSHWKAKKDRYRTARTAEAWSRLDARDMLPAHLRRQIERQIETAARSTER